MRHLLLLFLSLVSTHAHVALAFEPPARRRDQSQTTPGYILTPAAANIPGIGFTYGVLGSFFNVNESETDLFGFKFFGDLAGQGVGVVDMFVMPTRPELLTLNLFWNDFERVAIESHRRGIHSDPEDRNIVELGRFGLTAAQINLRLLDRRWQLNAGVNNQQARLAALRDKDGELITEGDGTESRSFNRSYGSVVDLTDDRTDPRDGLQAEVYRYDRPDPGGDEPHFYTMDYNLLYFVPVGSFSTWAFNLYRSDAVVTRPGLIDREEIKKNLNFSCDSIPESKQKRACQELESEYVSETESANRHGTASPLGGTQRLRSFVTNRFAAAHSVLAGSEFRWNLTEEFTPFNIFVAGGVRTGIQIAFFLEGGTVADDPADLSKHWRYSAGSGIRFILASGFVVRLDLASGNEGTQPSLIFQYPWSVF